MIDSRDESTRMGHDHEIPQITTIRPDTNIYLSWSRSIYLALKNRKLLVIGAILLKSKRYY